MLRFRSLVVAAVLALLLILSFSPPSPQQVIVAAPRNNTTLYLLLISRAATTPLQIHFIDVGQGNSILVIAPSGRSMLIDTGEANKATKVANYLQTVLGKKTVNFLVITHYHSDHLGAYTALLNNQGLVIEQATYDRGGTRNEYSTATYTSYYDLCTTTNPTACKRSTLHEGNTIDLGPSVQARVLCVGDILTNKTCGQNVISENDNSVLILLTMGTFDIWLGGDTSGDTTHTSYADVESAVVHQGNISQALDVYAVDHHGSCTSTNQTLVDATHPTVSIFQLGANSYGHPCAATVNRLAGSALYYTENSSGAVVNGDVKIVYSGGTSYSVSTLQGTQVFNTK